MKLDRAFGVCGVSEGIWNAKQMYGLYLSGEQISLEERLVFQTIAKERCVPKRGFERKISIRSNVGRDGDAEGGMNGRPLNSIGRFGIPLRVDKNHSPIFK